MHFPDVSHSGGTGVKMLVAKLAPVRFPLEMNRVLVAQQSRPGCVLLLTKRAIVLVRVFDDRS